MVGIYGIYGRYNGMYTIGLSANSVIRPQPAMAMYVSAIASHGLAVSVFSEEWN